MKCGNLIRQGKLSGGDKQKAENANASANSKKLCIMMIFCSAIKYDIYIELAESCSIPFILVFCVLLLFLLCPRYMEFLLFQLNRPLNDERRQCRRVVSVESQSPYPSKHLLNYIKLMSREEYAGLKVERKNHQM